MSSGEEDSPRVKELELRLRDEKERNKLLRKRVEDLENEIENLTTTSIPTSSGKRDILAMLNLKPSSTKRPSTHKKSGGVQAPRPSSTLVLDFKVNLIQKSPDEKKLIRSAINASRLLYSLESSQTADVIDSMSLCTYNPGDCVVVEGQQGNMFYVSASGTFEVSVNGNVLKTFGSGVVFGELAILYGCQRTATVKAIAGADGKSQHAVWCLSRDTFQMITMHTNVVRHQQRLKFVKSISTFSHLAEENYVCLVDALTEERYACGEYVIHQGSIGETFYIVQDGSFHVLQKDMSSSDAKVINTLSAGNTFGEKALVSDDIRTADVLAVCDSTVLVLDRVTYMRLICPRQGTCQAQQLPTFYDSTSPPTSICSKDHDEELDKCQLSDFETLGLLGSGSFGRVEFVRLKKTQETFALKLLSKKDIVSRKQQAHVFSERDIQASVRHPFISRLFRTFRDSRYVYMLLEPCLGGEMWCILRQCGRLTECETRFIIASVVEAIDHLHRRRIVFRDLKPGNLMLDHRGYCKLVDFGFAKKLVAPVHKTWTFCGTPEYMAPEVILHKGHGFSVDYWAIGIMIFELISGWLPFTSKDQLFTYHKVLAGFEGRKRFPANDFPEKAKNLVLALCRQQASDRLGVGPDGIDAIRRHKWFGTFSWVGLREQTLLAPISPDLKDPLDLSNFDQKHASRHPAQCPPEDFSGWDEGF